MRATCAKQCTCVQSLPRVAGYMHDPIAQWKEQRSAHTHWPHKYGIVLSTNFVLDITWSPLNLACHAFSRFTGASTTGTARCKPVFFYTSILSLYSTSSSPTSTLLKLVAHKSLAMSLVLRQAPCSRPFLRARPSCSTRWPPTLTWQ